MEIERKWLLNKLPDTQSYVYDDCEIRVRYAKPAPDHKGGPISRYKFTFKGSGLLSRIETEKELSGKEYDEYMNVIPQRPITKDYYTYFVGPYKIEVSKVDNSWIYAEVEFDSEEEAKNYVFPWPELVIQEVTYDEEYKMKNYWKDTRL